MYSSTHTQGLKQVIKLSTDWVRLTIESVINGLDDTLNIVVFNCVTSDWLPVCRLRCFGESGLFADLASTALLYIADKPSDELVQLPERSFNMLVEHLIAFQQNLANYQIEYVAYDFDKFTTEYAELYVYTFLENNQIYESSLLVSEEFIHPSEPNTNAKYAYREQPSWPTDLSNELSYLEEQLPNLTEFERTQIDRISYLVTREQLTK
jgi:hypothetical protein